MGTTAGTLSWDPHKNDATFIETFETWAHKEGMNCDPNYGEYNLSKTQFVADLSGFSRNSQKVKNFMSKCENELKRHNVKGIRVQISELPM